MEGQELLRTEKPKWLPMDAKPLLECEDKRSNASLAMVNATEIKTTKMAAAWLACKPNLD
jgi:hypothetical protein